MCPILRSKQFETAVRRFNKEFGKSIVPAKGLAEVEAQLDQGIKTALGAWYTSADGDVKPRLVEDVKTLLFQYISREASMLSDRLGSSLAEKFTDSKSVHGFQKGLTDEQRGEIDVLREFLRLMVAANAPEAYATGPATRWTVLLDQVFATGVKSGRKPEKDPNGPALPLHNLDVVVSLVEQVAFTLEHWAEDLSDGDQLTASDATNRIKWLKAVAGSAKYFARAGTSLLYLQHMGDADTKNMCVYASPLRARSAAASLRLRGVP